MVVKRVLIAEINPDAREILVKQFTMRRYHVVSVTNCDKLIEAAYRERFDLIVADIIMSDVSGGTYPEIIELIGTIPVIALTALSPQDLGPLESVFTKIFYKPINMNELFVYIESLLKDNTA